MAGRRAGVRGVPLKWRWPLAAVVALVVAGVLGWALWPSHPADQPRARRYLAFTACLLTGGSGVAGQDAKPVWAGMQDASLATHAKVQYLAVSGPQTRENAVPFVSSLAQGRCDLVIAAGDVPVAAVNSTAPRFPRTRFVAVGGGAPAPNVSQVTGASAAEVRAAVDHVVRTAAVGHE